MILGAVVAVIGVVFAALFFLGMVQAARETVQPRGVFGHLEFWSLALGSVVLVVVFGVYVLADPLGHPAAADLAAVIFGPLFFTLTGVFVAGRLVRWRPAREPASEGITQQEASPSSEAVAIDAMALRGVSEGHHGASNDVSGQFWLAMFMIVLGTLVLTVEREWFASMPAWVKDWFSRFRVPPKGPPPDAMQRRIVGWMLLSVGGFFAVHSMLATRRAGRLLR